jgi:hypothetical protein
MRSVCVFEQNPPKTAGKSTNFQKITMAFLIVFSFFFRIGDKGLNPKDTEHKTTGKKRKGQYNQNHLNPNLYSSKPCVNFLLLFLSEVILWD